MLEMAFRRFAQYTRLFVTYPRTTPRDRYLDKLASNPSILQQVPQRSIASYLGITPVPLSKIRRKI